MANKHLLNDYGNTIYYDGEVWNKDGTSLIEEPDASPGVGDEVNIQGFTWTEEDAQGKTVYSADELALLENKYFYQTLTQSSAFETMIASVPVDGVLRVGCNNNGAVDSTLKVNGVNVLDFTYIGTDGNNYPPMRTANNVFAWNVKAGDLVEVSSNSNGVNGRFIGGLIPFAYTNPG